MQSVPGPDQQRAKAMAEMRRTVADTPLGPVAITAQAAKITALTWVTSAPDRDADPLLSEASRQLAAYFAGHLRNFDLPLSVEGSDFQRAVCAEMQAIPFGETRSYGEIAKQLRAPAQAIGQACGNNPIPIFIPCHRVLGARGLGGFSARGGVDTKVALLRHEGAAGLLI
ncbi:MAG: cysteine methyltransferase [Pseudooceanicola sp.]|nr:cysteine methyltransferase [Pseudooceanicola sp.]